jgi:hypothetical protein
MNIAESVFALQTPTVATGPGIAQVWNMCSLPVFYITRQGRAVCVRPNRYALARATGEPLDADVLALYECDVPLCVKVARREALRQHVVAGTQRDNMIRMAYTGRGGGRPVIRRDGLRARRARSVALREAVRHGWDSAAVSAALLSSSEPTLW